VANANREIGGAWECAPISIRNPLIEDQAVLRPSLIPGLLAALERNLRGGAKAVRLFEIGRVFGRRDQKEQRDQRDEKDQRDAEERICLAAILTGAALPPSWCETAWRKTVFFDLKGCLETLGIEDLGFEAASLDNLLPAMRVSVGGKAAGVLGQLAPARLRALDSPNPVVLFELDLTNLRLRGIPSRIAPIPRFPAVTRDIAIIADSALPHARIEETLRAANEPLLVDIRLFDQFSDAAGIRVAAGQKSLAYSLTYRSAEKTLTADEVNAAHARLKERLKAALNVSFRE
jgi:phenylalanyl-tRNA synthetase beta chain